MKKRQKTDVCSFCLVLFSVFLLLTPCEGMAAGGKTNILSKVLRYKDDAITLGRQARNSGNVITAAEKAELLKTFPQLTKKGDDFLIVTKFIMDFAGQGTKQSRLLSALDNPVSLIRLEKNMPQVWTRIDDISSIMASAKKNLGELRKIPTLSAMPPQTAGKVAVIFGNYKATAEACMTMMRRGGKKAMDTLEKLKKYLPEPNMRNVILGLMAWHLVDPEGAEETIARFFEEHVIPMAAAPVKGIANGISDELPKLDVSTSGMLNAVKSLSTGTIALIIFAICMVVGPIRRMLGAALALPFDFCTRKIRQLNPGSESPRSPKKHGISSFDTSKFNADLNRGTKCRIKK